MRVDRLLPVVGIALLAALAACGGGSSPSPQAPQPAAAVGDILVTTTSSGEDQDLNAYVVKVGDDVRLIEWDDHVTYSSVPTGNWTVELQDVSENCSVADGATRSVSVAENSTSEVTFEVSCARLPAAAVDVSGTWRGDWEGGHTGGGLETGSMTLVLAQDGDKVIGSIKIQRSGDSTVYDYGIEDGRVSDSTMTLFFLGKEALGQSNYRFTSIGEVTAPSMSGSTEEQMQLWSGTFTVTRQ